MKRLLMGLAASVSLVTALYGIYRLHLIILALIGWALAAILSFHVISEEGWQWWYDLTYNPMLTVLIATTVNTGIVLLVDYLRNRNG